MQVHAVNEDDDYAGRVPGIVFPNYADRKFGDHWQRSGNHLIFPTKLLEELQRVYFQHIYLKCFNSLVTLGDEKNPYKNPVADTTFIIMEVY